MADQLVVIVGAGASYDCVGFGPAAFNESLRPPLVRDLFADHFRDALDRYTLMKPVAAEVWARMAEVASHETLALEDYLREQLLESSLPERRAMYWAVPLYLQDILHACGRYSLTHADNFQRLVGAFLEIERVAYITLNYDTILDRVIGNYRPIDDTLASYAYYDIGLFKLHGSVNWRRDVNVAGIDRPAEFGWRSLCHGLATAPERLSESILLASPAGDAPSDVEMMRFDGSGGGEYWYPALAAPLGPDDSLVCPSSHTEALIGRLGQQDNGYGLHVLILGYSCVDRAPLDLIADSGNVIKSLVIVNGSRDAGEAALESLRMHLKAVAPYERRGDHVEVFAGGFKDFARPPLLKDLVDRVKSA